MAELALPAPHIRRAALLWTGLAVLAALLCLQGLVNRPPLPDGLDQVLFWQSLLPRTATALLAGAALGLAGTLLQLVLRNPIADPSTLGIASGAQLALTVAAVSAPLLDAVPREAVALAGGGMAAAIVLALGWKRGLDPVTVVLSGMTISLVAAALSAAIILAHGDYVLSLFIWGAGSLHQQSWAAPTTLAWRLVLGMAAASMLLRPLAVMGLGDAQARSLGVALHSTRFLVILVAVWLAASVTALVGVIGFVGLAAPAFARLSGARTQRGILLLAPLLGALLLWLTDGLVQFWRTDAGDLLPTGAATGLLGGPLLLWLLPRLAMGDRPPPAMAPIPFPRAGRPWRALSWLLAAGVLLALASLTIGRDLSGWQLATGQLLADLLPFRLPRLAVAVAAGALLGAAGTVMQRLTGNPMASPEVLGVSAGAGVGLSAVLLLLAAPGPGAMLLGSGLGALATLLAILAFGARTGFGPERLLLAGIALGAACLAIMAAVLATGRPQAFTLLVWMSGSTDRASPAEAVATLIGAAVLLAPLPLLPRWLDILPLGGAVARALGVPVRASRLILALMAAVMTALAASVVGPISLVGLVGPHLARLLGFARGREQVLAAALLGAMLMLIADWLGHMVIFPYQIPVGLFVALVGGPYLIWLLRRGEAKRG